MFLEKEKNTLEIVIKDSYICYEIVSTNFHDKCEGKC